MSALGVKVIGAGLVSCLGAGVTKVYGAMCAGLTGFRPITRFDTEPYAQKQGGQLPEELEERLRQDYEDDDLAVAMVKCAGEEALGCKGAAEASDQELGLVLATNFGPMETLEWAWRERLDTGVLDQESYANYGQVIEDVATYFGCGGPRLQLTMSCASGAASVQVAGDMIRSGRARRVLVVAYDVLTEYCWCGLSNLRTITMDTMRPFDVERSGTLFSEGAAAVVLAGEEEPGEPWGWIAGSATNNNGYHMTAPRKEAEGSRLVMQEALRQAGLNPDDVEHICAHGTSTHANDETEAGAFRNLFGQRLGDIPVSAFKSQLGHMLGAAGLAEAIISLAAMRGGVLPPIVNLQRLDPACQPLNCGSGVSRPVKVETTITNSAGIGGNNASLVLTSHAVRSVSPSSLPERLYVRQMSWVLPAGVGQGGELLAHGEWLEGCGGLGALANFDSRPYVHSVKGYLDSGDAYMLSAFGLLAGERGVAFDSTRGICTATRYGTCRSAFGFFEQMVSKGPRLASPMIFPHGYASAPGNLGAIEGGWCGPHMVLMGNQDVRESLEFALARLLDGSCEEMLVGAYESAVPQAVPDGVPPLQGALAVRLSLTAEPGDLGSWRIADVRALPATGMADGAVAAWEQLILNLH